MVLKQTFSNLISLPHWDRYYQIKNKHFSKMVLVVLLITIFGLGNQIVNMQPSYAAPPVVAINTVLTPISDGSIPFPTLDPNGNNNLLATLDSSTYTFDLNINTLDTAPHTVSNVTIVATLNSIETEISWQLASSLPSYCATKTISANGKVLTCVLSGTYATGSTFNIPAYWWAHTGADNNSVVDVSFTASATMIPDSSLGTNPTTSTSNVDTVTIVCEPGTWEVQKGGTAATVSTRDGAGNPLTVDVDWGVQVQVAPNIANQIKGINTDGFGDLALTDNLSFRYNSNPAFIVRNTCRLCS